MKTCPYCAEEIQDAAVKCKHCQSEISQEQGTSSGSPTVDAVNKLTKNESDVRWRGYARKAKILMASLFIYWIGSNFIEGFSDYGLLAYLLVGISLHIVFFILTGRQIKFSTKSKWSYWAGITVIWFWGLGGYASAQDAHKKHAFSIALKILTVVSYPIAIIFLWLTW